jgi:hypothetical protein
MVIYNFKRFAGKFSTMRRIRVFISDVPEKVAYRGSIRVQGNDWKISKP